MENSLAVVVAVGLRVVVVAAAAGGAIDGVAQLVLAPGL